METRGYSLKHMPLNPPDNKLASGMGKNLQVTSYQPLESTMLKKIGTDSPHAASPFAMGQMPSIESKEEQAHFRYKVMSSSSEEEEELNSVEEMDGAPSG